MVSISIPNVITIGLISLAAIAVAKWGLGAAGIKPAWL